MRNILFSPPDITELEISAVADAMRSGWITTGARTKELEAAVAAFCGSRRAVCLNSATACLELALRALGVGEGDEVITSAYTYTASASPAVHVGARLVLADTAPDSYEMDYGQLEALITERTKAVIPVDLGGVMCDYGRIFEIVEGKRGLFRPSGRLQERIGRAAVIADAAHAFGACRGGVRCGCAADFTSFSFHAVKNLTTAEGGALTWRQIPGVDDEELYREFMLLSLHGQSKDAFHKSMAGSWEYDVVSPAYKCNMTDIAAAMGLAQLERYPGMLERRREIIGRYDRAFGPYGLDVLPHLSGGNRSSGHLYMVRIPGCGEAERNGVIRGLAEEGIAANVHYKPLPMMTAYRSLGFRIGDYPNAYRRYENEVTLPLHTRLSDDDVEYVIDGMCRRLGRMAVRP